MDRVVAMILAGGRVDELSVLTFFRPKSAVPFGGLYRVIDFPMSNLMHSGIERAGVLSQYRPYSLINHLDAGAPWDMVGRRRGVFILPPFKGLQASDWYKGTADAVYQNLDFIARFDPELVLIISGDHIYRMDYRPLIEFHRRHRADLTVAFTEIKDITGAHRFGQGEIEDTYPDGGPLVSYVEKPSQLIHPWASLTIYVFRRPVLEEVLEANAQESSHEFGRDIIPKMLGIYRVFGYKHRGYWGYSRTIEEYWQTNMDLLGPLPKIDLCAWQIRTNLAHRDVRDRQPTIVGPKARIENTLFYNGGEILGEVVNSILFPGVRIAEGARVKNSILFYDTVVETGAHLEKVIADAGVVVEAGVRVGAEAGWDGPVTVIGRQSRVASGVEIEPGVTIYPHLTPEAFSRPRYRSGEVIQ
ncbi:glucose-1-phosphate adenylyltransferase [Thermosulfuriphilus ammonigenes]|uniref:Glucose-1-phosphate adenylyltransferase n=1 Tax=Thermosulfuriphilus ammonigenes TaxID=1936021 RepID=A0A6G7PWV6_9BACT|nr:sugar phosphate nucleotidyltransferase [Thermosulfuriphilus ammonigenes]MBA2847728.1 glucose-1-phosphate adenylyltransferase [Thermosulfuriphilus ammonigenes]QIJ72067.1 glucose-1-phosphate adenylyltransferase [Thermosulfuriphilus ammonigenes]